MEFEGLYRLVFGRKLPPESPDVVLPVLRPRATDDPDVDRVAFKRALQGEIYEIRASTPFYDRLVKLDNLLFPLNGDVLRQGWRLYGVKFGRYLAPEAESVPELMDMFTDKVDQLYFNEVPTEAAKDKDIAAFACWMIVFIHPKAEGNGRFAQAVAEYLLPRKHVLGHKEDLWELALTVGAANLWREVSSRNNIPLESTGIPWDDQNFKEEALDRRGRRDFSLGLNVFISIKIGIG